ncbi:hypothetical protein PMAYCL1PPCAC_28348, partial [Pristionchus mayeri]
CCSEPGNLVQPGSGRTGDRMLRQLLTTGPTTTTTTEIADAGNIAMLSNVSATTLPFTTSSVSGTSELFSSTFAMLSEGDGISDAWEKPRVYENGMEDFARFGGEFVGNPFDQTNRLPILYPGQHPTLGLPTYAPIASYPMPPTNAAVTAAAAAAAAAAPFGHPTMILQPAASAVIRPMQHAALYPQSLAASIPIAPQTVQIPALSGSPDDGRPQIGRAFVESIGGQTKPVGAAASAAAASVDSGTGAGSPPKPGMVSSTGEGGLSPICPYCERFISHYKGNIRRHINQCCKNGGKRLKTPKNPACGGTSSTSGKRRKFAAGSEGTPAGEGWPAAAAPAGEMTLYEHITANFNGGGVAAATGVQPMQQSNPLYDLPPSTNSAEGSSSCHHPDSTTPPKKTSESDVPDDPYLCPYCDFLTVYKGNMKRHLNTCHPAEMEKGDTRLDDMRASVQGVANEELNAKLNAHKMNSTRGRKPKVGKLGMDTSGSALSPNGNDHSLGSGGSSTTSPMSNTADPYYRPPVSGHMLHGGPMMSYPPMYQQAPQHLLMVASGAPPPGYGYHHVQMQQLQQPYLQQAPPPPQPQQLQQQHMHSEAMTSVISDGNATRENGPKKEVKSEDESDFDDEEEDSEDDEGKGTAS